tara:strand:+ start:135 stop:533 length:399 start_codon:yes stop_codon:yes gene_type:complete
MEVNPLIPVGTKVKVDKSKIENILPDKLFNDLPKLINGKVIDYKMTDGMDIGYVLITENNLKIWIFSNELNSQTRREYKIEIKNNSKYNQSKKTILGFYKINYVINGNRNIKTLTNPFNLINWLIYVIKDIF